jgi:hypothetical protein
MHQIIKNYIAALELIDYIVNHPQLDPKSGDFVGFLTVGEGLWPTQEMEEAWRYVCKYNDFFEKIIDNVGLSTRDWALDSHRMVIFKEI